MALSEPCDLGGGLTGADALKHHLLTIDYSQTAEWNRETRWLHRLRQVWLCFTTQSYKIKVYSQVWLCFTAQSYKIKIYSQVWLCFTAQSYKINDKQSSLALLHCSELQDKR